MLRSPARASSASSVVLGCRPTRATPMQLGRRPCAAWSRLPCSSVASVSPFPSPTPIGGARSGGGGVCSWREEVRAHGAPPAACAVHSMRDEVLLLVAEEFRRRIVPHSMRVFVVVQLGDARDAVQSLWACSTANAISSHWSVDHGRAARRCSPCGSGLVCVQSAEHHLHLFPCCPSTMVVQLGDARRAVQGSCLCNPAKAIYSPAVCRPWHAVWGPSPCGSGSSVCTPTSIRARQVQ
ncbi:hypothetical protein ACQJBY_039352 [Aegilops geniculata]